ncbi:hypothetical protein [Moraxella oblonga]|uniref:hypothetical protein n=1 Tax=Moraxella oblonga TaxID=200413 RepID=UPI000834B16C|nr:hypothetical protein [Moraxella oblonga]
MTNTELDVDMISKISQEIAEMCQEPDTASKAIMHWVRHETVEEDAIKAICHRACVDMDVKSAYYLVRILQVMPESERTIDIQPLLELVSDFGDDLNETITEGVNREMLDELQQENQA